MRRSRYLQSFLAAALALAVPGDLQQAMQARPVEWAIPGPPLAALLAAGLALGLARGEGGVRRPVRRRRG